MSLWINAYFLFTLNITDSNEHGQDKEDTRSTQSLKIPNKIHPDQSNGVIIHENGNKLDLTKKSMRGDLSLYNEAKLIREKTMKERLRKRERLAGVGTVFQTCNTVYYNILILKKT